MGISRVRVKADFFVLASAAALRTGSLRPKDGRGRGGEGQEERGEGGGVWEEGGGRREEGGERGLTD